MPKICPRPVLDLSMTQWDLCHPKFMKYAKANPKFDNFYRKYPHYSVTGNA